jgi:hypothetical protein
MSALMNAERIQEGRPNLEARNTGERGRQMTENTVRLRETNKGIGVPNHIQQRRDFARVSRQRAEM